MSLVSIIIPCFGMGKYVGDALSSIGIQTHQNWEALAVDDCGPEDGTRKAIEVFAETVPTHRVEYYRHAVNRGQGAARNTGVAAAKGNWLAFLDPDDYWDSNYLQEQLQFLTSNPFVDAAYTGTFKVDADQNPLEAWEPSKEFDAGLPESLFVDNFINPSAAVVKRKAFTEVGGFDETTELRGHEDWDLWIRLILKGRVFRRSPAPRIYYRRHPGACYADPSHILPRTKILMTKHCSEPRLVLALLERLRHREMELAETREDYRKLLTAYFATFDRRIKDALKSILGGIRTTKPDGERAANR